MGMLRLARQHIGMYPAVCTVRRLDVVSRGDSTGLFSSWLRYMVAPIRECDKYVRSGHVLQRNSLHVSLRKCLRTCSFQAQSTTAWQLPCLLARCAFAFVSN